MAARAAKPWRGAEPFSAGTVRLERDVRFMTTPRIASDPSTDRAYQEALGFLWQRINYERTAPATYPAADFRLARMHRLMALLGDPHLGLPVVHVAGTKGKGSISTMVAEAIRRNGLRVGLYTSPHLERIEERYVLDGRPCLPAELVRLVEWVRPAVEQLDRWAASRGERGATFFEITTAMAFGYFAHQGVDLAVLEVGMGGRLDSTNVCRPELCIISAISFDHTRQLGNTLSAIASEKAGIIKRHVPVVTSVRDEEPLQVIRHKAAEQQAPLYELGQAFAIRLLTESDTLTQEQLELGGGDGFTYHEPPQGPPLGRPLRLSMLGAHQCENAGAALAALRRLGERGWPINEATAQRAVAETRVPGRLELAAVHPAVLLDVAHNPASIAALVKVVRRLPVGAWTFVVAFSRDKDIPAMLRTLLPVARALVITRFTTNPRSAQPEKVAAMARRLTSEINVTPNIYTVEDPHQAWQKAWSQVESGGGICVTGSFFLVGELRQRVLAEVPRRPDVAPLPAQEPSCDKLAAM
ncbi:MAG: folylpolyglutamate synthase [Pirellulaceae bacterium]|nr:MAG: folylpolyglutamate synthase [Pirellulaceae bacterium]